MNLRAIFDLNNPALREGKKRGEGHGDKGGSKRSLAVISKKKRRVSPEAGRKTRSPCSRGERSMAEENSARFLARTEAQANMTNYLEVKKEVLIYNQGRGDPREGEAALLPKDFHEGEIEHKALG